MNDMKKSIPLFAVLLFVCLGVRVQAQESNYDPHKAFAPLSVIDGGNMYRSADGTPGPRYWQNAADYTIEAALDTTTRTLSGEVTIAYTNNSPNKLDQLWLELVHNARKANSKAAKVRGNLSDDTAGDQGFDLHKVQVNTGSGWQQATYKIYGTRMQIRLDKPLNSKGGEIRIAIEYDYTLPKYGRGSYMDSKNGMIYEVSYWYPRMRVYDDLHGWNTRPFLGAGEFYLDYGTIDYKVTLPEGMLMAGSGTLMNPNEVLTEEQQQRLEKARETDETVMIRSKEDLSWQPPKATMEPSPGITAWKRRAM